MNGVSRELAANKTVILFLSISTSLQLRISKLSQKLTCHVHATQGPEKVCHKTSSVVLVSEDISRSRLSMLTCRYELIGRSPR